jgi:hypothetical protein
MLHWTRITAISAILAAGVVAFGDAGSAATSGKIADRLPASVALEGVGLANAKAVAVAGSPSGGEGIKSSRATPELSRCGLETWPYISAECIASTDRTASSRQVRTITVEKRDAPNTSVLVRVPQTTVATR